MQASQPQLPCTSSSCKRQRQSSFCTHATSTVDNTPVGVGEIADVEDVEGIRVVVGDANRPLIEYLIKWKVREHVFLIGFRKRLLERVGNLRVCFRVIKVKTNSDLEDVTMKIV